MNYKYEIAKKINQIVNIPVEELATYIEIPPNTEMGDYAFPCFKLAKEMRKAPPMIAAELKEKLTADEIISKIEVAGGYLNFFIDKNNFVKDVMEEAIKEGENFGKSNIGEGKNVVLDYSSPNIAKPFHIGHLRSTVIGGALYKIYKFLGYNVIGVNHLGDWGMGVCRTIAGYNLWKDEYDFNESAIDSILKIYVRFNKIEKEDPTYKDYAVEALKKLEAGDEETVALWKWIIKISLEDYQKIYDLIGCKFDSFNGEAFYIDKTDRVIDEIKAKNLLEESEGAYVVRMDDDMPPCIILTSAGTTIYATRDLAALLYRIDNYNFDKCIYVVGNEQKLHFKQIFSVLAKMGYEEYAKKCEHISFGLILDETGEKIGSRKGNIITLKEIFNEAIEKSLKLIEEKNPDLENKEDVARMVGVGAIVFNDLADNRTKDEIFDWNEILNFAGETGPYMQYAYVRTQSILRKAGYVPETADFSKLLDNEAVEVVKLISNFTNTVIDAAAKNEPSILSRYLIDLSQSYSKFYKQNHVICDDKEVQDARLLLTKTVGDIIKNGLGLLGIECPERM
ncbi:MAG: arginine--tRNA ligase [Clostridiales bacterium]|nr:arginine--tRNA ligase [Clostridiales bacterium]